MAFLDIKNVRIAGISACVPKKVVDNMDYELLSDQEKKKYIETTGVRYRHCVEDNICTSDLCYEAAEKVIDDLEWEKSEIDLLVFVSQTPDYKMPTTACVLQARLGLSNNCMAFDISLGCTAYVYGLSTIASLLSNGKIKKALLLVGNTQSRNVNYKDKSSFLLFGDAGTATALEYNPLQADVLQFNLQTFGEGENSIIIPDGGYRNPINENSFIESTDEEGNVRSPSQIKMDGMDVFSFVISKVPKAFKALYNHFEINADSMDYVLIHHANKMLCEKVRKKLKIAEEKVPYNIENFGNSSGASVPLLMVTNLKDTLTSQKTECLISGFGVGLSLGVGRISLNKIVVSNLILK
jgi:3-oxoacyl-[acyl-carrier-protein] synthase-3